MSADDEQDENSGEDPGEREPPKYTVYRAGEEAGRPAAAPGEEPGGAADAAAPAPEAAPPSPEAPKPTEKPEPRPADPAYTLYKSRRGPLAALRNVDVAALRERLRPGSTPGPPESPVQPAITPERPVWRRVLKWAAIAAGAWLALSVVLFVISAQIQKGKLNGEAADLLGGNPFLVASGQTILVIGTDARSAESNEPGAETDAKCIEAGAHGDPPDATCLGFRSDTLMLIRAGGGAFEKLSIPRDSFAEIPGQGAQKINAAYAFGGAPLTIETVENFLGIDVDHAVILDFDGFADFIDSIGGVEVALRGPVKSEISGGAANGGITLRLPKGRSTLNGQEALALARTRTNLKDPTENDLDRALRQQLILQGIKDRLTSPTRIPYNFLKGPWIAWNAPKAFVSDMGGLTLPQLVMAAGIGGDSKTEILGKTAATGPGGSLLIPASECRKAVNRFIGSNPDGKPACSPGA